MISNKIIKDWSGIFPCLDRIGKNSFFSESSFFLYGFSIDELRGNKDYRIFIRLINLASGIHLNDKIDYTRPVINICLTGRNGTNFNIPINFHSQYFEEAKSKLTEQAPFPFCNNIVLQNIISHLINAINNKHTALVDTPLLELEFLMQICSIYKKEIIDSSLFNKLKQQLEDLDSKRIDYFMGDREKWIYQLLFECQNPQEILDKAKRRFPNFKKGADVEIIVS